jgi:FtsP/CotA-like multicopper oxidase with cupredoxin domain
VIAPGERHRYKLVPKPSGTRWYRASTMAGTQPGYASAAGPFGFLYVEPRRERGDYDRELFLAIRQWEPISGKHGEIEAKVSRPEYRYASFNDKLLGAGEPIRVREGERVLFRFLNAGPGQDITLSLPGHRFAVIALDGNPVPNPCCVEVLSLAVGERVDAMVEMMHPGKWVLGSLSHAERRKGLGIVVEYANRVGQANWSMPQARGWSYALFAASDKSNSRSEETIELMLERQAKGEGGSDHLSINGKPLSGMDPLQLSPGVGYRLRLLNATEHPHTMHLPHQTFEIVRLNQFSIAGIWKDTVRLKRYGAMDANFIADKAAPFLPEFLGQGHTQQEEMPMVRM